LRRLLVFTALLVAITVTQFAVVYDAMRRSFAGMTTRGIVKTCGWGHGALPCYSLADHLLPVVFAGGLTVKCSGPSSSLTATGSSQQGHGPPGPRRRAKVLQSSQRCSPR